MTNRQVLIANGYRQMNETEFVKLTTGEADHVCHLLVGKWGCWQHVHANGTVASGIDAVDLAAYLRSI